MADDTHPDDAPPNESVDERQIGFNMPCTWEHMLALGLDPLTGAPT